MVRLQNMSTLLVVAILARKTFPFLFAAFENSDHMIIRVMDAIPIHNLLFGVFKFIIYFLAFGVINIKLSDLFVQVLLILCALCLRSLALISPDSLVLARSDSLRDTGLSLIIVPELGSLGPQRRDHQLERVLYFELSEVADQP